MRAVLQRVKEAKVEVDNSVIGRIDKGLLIFLGVGTGDSETDAQYLANKISGLRIFADANEMMNLSLTDIKGAALVVSQFTLLGDCRKGKRPSFVHAARPEKARPLYNYFNKKLKETGIEVATGRFGAMMEVSLINDGPVTFVIDSKKTS